MDFAAVFLDMSISTEIETLSFRVIGAALEVHRNLGPGLLESIYEECFCLELELRKIGVERQKQIPLVYKDISLRTFLRLDLLVEKSLIIELKAVHEIEPVHTAQLLSYLRLSSLPLGLIINFNVPLLKDGIRRVIL